MTLLKYKMLTKVAALSVRIHIHFVCLEIQEKKVNK